LMANWKLAIEGQPLFKIDPLKWGAYEQGNFSWAKR
jgi:hypothetical protein